jgi:hypothetical protein
VSKHEFLGFYSLEPYLQVILVGFELEKKGLDLALELIFFQDLSGLIFLIQLRRE